MDFLNTTKRNENLNTTRQYHHDLHTYSKKSNKKLVIIKFHNPKQMDNTLVKMENNRFCRVNFKIGKTNK